MRNLEVPVAIAAFYLVLGLIPALIAQRKGRSFIGYWAFGTFFFIIALIVALVVSPPNGRSNGRVACLRCAELLAPGAVMCRFCGLAFDEPLHGPATPPAGERPGSSAQSARTGAILLTVVAVVLVLCELWIWLPSLVDRFLWFRSMGLEVGLLHIGSLSATPDGLRFTCAVCLALCCVLLIVSAAVSWGVKGVAGRSSGAWALGGAAYFVVSTGLFAAAWYLSVPFLPSYFRLIEVFVMVDVLVVALLVTNAVRAFSAIGGDPADVPVTVESAA